MANVTVIVGTQWGNEGKGRIAHQVSKECIAVRGTGSSKAGHTVMIGGQKFTLHLLPAAIGIAKHSMYYRSRRRN